MDFWIIIKHSNSLIKNLAIYFDYKLLYIILVKFFDFFIKTSLEKAYFKSLNKPKFVHIKIFISVNNIIYIISISYIL